MPLKEVDWDSFVFRSHYFGELMTPVKGKSNLELYNEAVEKYNKQYDIVDGWAKREGKMFDNALDKLFKLQAKVDELAPLKQVPNLSDTCKRRLVKIYTEETTGRIDDIDSMYIDKGLMTEEDSITLYSLRTGLFYKKNKERRSNGFVTGEIDFQDEEKDLVIDTKSSWDIFTFDATIARAIGRTYWWQGQCYMWLFDRQNFRLAYCLNNTPNELVKKIIKRMEYNFVGDQEDWDKAVEALKHKHDYSDLPDDRRIRVYDIKRDDEKIEQAKSMIPHFRNYLKNITNAKFEEDDT